jgi:formylglycine-generating enzyme required for sulfatase activity/ribosomal protein L40E
MKKQYWVHILVVCILILMANLVFAVKICPKCGAENKDDAKYCYKCGTKLPDIRIPSVIGLNSDNAIARLKNLGLKVKIDSVQGEKTNIVTDQNPDADSFIFKGNTVKITVSFPSPTSKWITNLKSYDGWPVLGKSAAGISIGDSIDFVINDLGQPTKVESFPSTFTWSDNNNQLKIITKNKKVDLIEVVMSTTLQKDMRTAMRSVLKILNDTNAYQIGIREYKKFGIDYFIQADSLVTYFHIFSKKELPKWLKKLNDMKNDFLKRHGCLGLSSDTIRFLFGEPQSEHANSLSYLSDNNSLTFSVNGEEVDTVNMVFSQDLLDSLSLPKTFDDIIADYGTKYKTDIHDNIIFADSGIIVGLKDNKDVGYIKLYYQEYENMVLVPADFFLLLGTSNIDIKDMNKALDAIQLNELKINSNDIKDEMPQEVIWLDSFYIDKYEVTNKQFQKFVNATNYKNKGDWKTWFKLGQENYPVRGVTWEDAEAYAEWAGKELPTEFQWEKAAKGNGGYWFPWGNSFDATHLANYDNPGGDVVSIDSFKDGQSVYGVFNMAGNVREWCRNDYFAINDYYKNIPKRNPQGTANEANTVDVSDKTIRGGSFMSSITDIRTAKRDFLPEDEYRKDLGFRCIKKIKH